MFSYNQDNQNMSYLEFFVLYVSNNYFLGQQNKRVFIKTINIYFNFSKNINDIPHCYTPKSNAVFDWIKTRHVTCQVKPVKP
jgi:hypothetical protein